MHSSKEDTVYQLYLDAELFIRYRDYYKEMRTAKGAITAYCDTMARETMKKEGIEFSLSEFYRIKDEHKLRFTVKETTLEGAVIKVGNTRKARLTKLTNDIINNSRNPLLVGELAKKILEELGGK
jgi:hypothetical protein